MRASRYGHNAGLTLELGFSRPEALTPAALVALQRFSGNRSVVRALSLWRSQEVSRRRTPPRMGAGGPATQVQRALEPAEMEVAGWRANTRIRMAKPVDPAHTLPRVDEDRKLGVRLYNRDAVQVDWDSRDVTGEWVRAQVGATTGYIRISRLKGGGAHAAKPWSGACSVSALPRSKAQGWRYPRRSKLLRN